MQALRSALRNDLRPGLVNAVVGVPDGLASAALAGVNPVFGLYTSITGPIAGSLLVSSRLMQITTTSASALAAGQAIAAYPQAQRESALFLLTVLVGAFLAVFALLRLGRLVRFVSHAVMNGFLLGVALILVLDQLAPLLGVSVQGANEVVQAWNLLTRLDEVHARSAWIGAMALLLLVVVGRSAWGKYASLLALVLPTLAMLMLGWSDVRTVADVSPIPQALPALSLPTFSLATPGLVLAAASLAVVIGVQGAGVGQSLDNPDNQRTDASRDLLAQGASNVAAGLFSGIPAGGSVGQTALNVSLGAASRWAGFFSGLWMLVIVLLLPQLIGRVPMPVLAAVMVVAGWQAIDAEEARGIWRTGGNARTTLLVTLGATLLLSVPAAVMVGVVVAFLLAIRSAARDVRLRQLVPADGQDWRVGEPPARLDGDAVVVLDVVGSVFFAGARTLQDALPVPGDMRRPVVVLRLHGRPRVGATLIDVLHEYAEDLGAHGGRLYLAGLGPELMEQLAHVGKLEAEDAVQLVPGQALLGASTRVARDKAMQWRAQALEADAAHKGQTGSGG